MAATIHIHYHRLLLLLNTFAQHIGVNSLPKIVTRQHRSQSLNHWTTEPPCIGTYSVLYAAVHSLAAKL